MYTSKGTIFIEECTGFSIYQDNISFTDKSGSRIQVLNKDIIRFYEAIKREKGNSFEKYCDSLFTKNKPRTFIRKDDGEEFFEYEPNRFYIVKSKEQFPHNLHTCYSDKQLDNEHFYLKD
jgi:hypothetical protein